MAFMRIVATVIALVVWVPGAVAQPAGLPEVTSYRLDNGLEVILAPDAKVPKVAFNLHYGVGRLNEPAGRSGFAHLFEHLMLFAGTPAYPRMDEDFTAAGVDFNGFTMEDYTTYVAEGMAASLPLMLSIYADRMANLGAAVEQANLDLQRSVVLNEMRQNVLDAPAMSAVTALRSGLFPAGHPYSRAVIGSIPDLAAATLGDVRAFFDAYYAPNNAVLVIAGDFDVAATQALIADTFGRIPRGVEVVHPVPAPFAPTHFRLEATDAVASPLVYLAFDGPAMRDGPRNAALLFATDLMSNASGLLRLRLVNTGIATAARGFWAPGKLGGRFIIYASAAPGVSAEDLEAALRETVAAILATPIDRADMERTRSNVLLNIRTQIEAFATRAAFLAEGWRRGADLTRIFADDPDIVAATPEAVEAAMATVLRLDDASTAIIRPGPRGDYPAVLAEASGEAVPLDVPPRAGVAIPQLAAGGPLAATLPERETAALSNGIEVVHYRMAGAPLFYAAAMVSGGTDNDPRGQEGLYDLAVEMAYRGAGARDLEALARAAKDIGASVASWAGTQMSGTSLSVPPENLAAGVELLADVVQAPRFDPAEWEVVRASVLNGLVQRDADLESVAARALARVLLQPGPTDSDIAMTVGSVAAISLDDLARAYAEMITPRTMRIQTVGDLPLAAVVAALEPRFGSSWQDDDAGLVARPPLTPVFPAAQQVYVVAVPGTSQAAIQIARPAPGTDLPVYASAAAVTNLLAADFSGRLNTVIREQKGYSYGVSGSLWDTHATQSALTVSMPVQIDATGPALAEAFAGFASLIDQPVTAAEVTRSISAYHTLLAGLPETAGGFFGGLVGMQQDGIALDQVMARVEQMTRLDLAEVQAAATDLASLAQAVIIVAGDPERIEPQLEALGISEIGRMAVTPGDGVAIVPEAAAAAAQ